MTRVRSLLLAAALAPAVAAVTAAAAFLLTGSHHRSGVTAEEAARRMPGDDLLPKANVQNDRAILIAAPPEMVWPWIAQLGQNKAGFYSFEVLENMIGCDIHNADRIVPEWQNPQVGDAFPLAPELALSIAVLEPGRALVATSQGGASPQDMGYDFTWAFVLDVAVGEGTRLHVRERFLTHAAKFRAVAEVTSVMSAVMSWKMLRTIKDVAERGPVASH